MDYEDAGFARKVGYVQQQDLHLSISTVREALEFSALLRQSTKCSREKKLAYVNEIIETLGMSSFANAVIGIPGEGIVLLHVFHQWINGTDELFRSQRRAAEAC